MTADYAKQLKRDNDRLHAEALAGGKANEANARAYRERGDSLNRMIARLVNEEAKQPEQMVAGAK